MGHVHLCSSRSISTEREKLVRAPPVPGGGFPRGPLFAETRATHHTLSEPLANSYVLWEPKGFLVPVLELANVHSHGDHFLAV